MNNWTITALYYGQLTLAPSAFGGLDTDLKVDFPFTGFLLRNGTENVLVDTGMKESYFEQMAIGDVNPVGSTQLLLDALAEEGLTPADIDTVIYTHLHYDHMGNMDLFPDAVTYVQRKEYENMMHPLPFQNARMDYFPDAPEQFKKLKHVIFVDGDLILPNGLELFLTPGHSLGGQSIVVPTAKGRYVLTGDIPSAKYALFPETDHIVQMDGSVVNITPLTDGSLTFLEGQFNNDWFSAYSSHYKQLAKAEKPIPEYLIPSHEPENIYRKHFG